MRILSDIYHVSVEIVDATDEKIWLAAVSQAGAVLLETPSNPLMKLIDIEKTVQAAHSHKAPVIVDNTVATPLNQRPFDFGADWVVHSTSKYLNGHSDMIGGCAVSKKALLPQQRNIHKNLGGTVNALDAWLVLRGLRTFNLRMERHNQNGRAIAEWLSSRTEVLRVYYPGFSSQIQTGIFEKQMKHGGSLLSFELAAGEKGANRFLDRVNLITHAVSLGGVESLAARPAKSSHRGMNPEARQRAGISDGLIRLSVGIESIEDLLADLSQALT
jgi:cystathionine beta-lyase/cystathionine gamma-synthase